MHPAVLTQWASDNPTGADNQQERPGAEQWVVGFVDGEGCFSISVVRNATCKLGWQVQHEFAVTQAAPSRAALEYLVEVFGCGTAAVITPVGTLGWKGEDIAINDGKPGEVSKRLFDAITGVQSGREPDKHGWMTVLDAT